MGFDYLAVNVTVLTNHSGNLTGTNGSELTAARQGRILTYILVASA